MKKMTRLFACAGAMTLLSASAAFGGTWQNDGGRWWYDNGDGTYAVNGWQWIDGNGDGAAECYYFDESGYCLTDTITPDGYTVDANGAWTVDGQVQYAAVNTSSAGQEEEWYQKLYQALMSGDFAYIKQEMMAGDAFIEKCRPYLVESLAWDEYEDVYCIPVGNGKYLGISTSLYLTTLEEINNAEIYRADGRKNWNSIRVFTGNPTDLDFTSFPRIGLPGVSWNLNYEGTGKEQWMLWDGKTMYYEGVINFQSEPYEGRTEGAVLA